MLHIITKTNQLHISMDLKELQMINHIIQQKERAQQDLIEKYPYDFNYYRITNDTSEILLLKYLPAFVVGDDVFLNPGETRVLTILRETGFVNLMVVVGKDDGKHQKILEIAGQYNVVTISHKHEKKISILLI